MQIKAKQILIAVAWPYVNGDLHIGHLAGYLLPADTCARFQSFIGNNVLMVSGSDCFGTPTTIEADKRKITPQDVVAEYHSKNVELFSKVGVGFEEFGLFTKTDTANHKRVAQDIFVKMAERGLISKQTTEQYFSPDENRFLPDRYVEGVCPVCDFDGARSDQCDKCGSLLNQGELKNARSKNTGTKVELRPTEHYFVNWPELEPWLQTFVDSRGDKWRNWIREETKGWLTKGLKPRAITRDLDWGVEIPIDRLPENLWIEGAAHKRIYVWFEAVLGYLSASIEWAERYGKDWKEWWYNPEAKHYYFMGKDNLVFHTLFLPGELHAYDENIHLPDYPIINQFLNLEGQKFSKSRGVIVDSRYIVETYGRDPVRFYLTLISPENADSNFSWEDFVRSNNSILIGNIGNFINRTLTLGKELKFKGEVDVEIEKNAEEKLKTIKKLLQNCEFKKALETFLELSDYANKYIAKEEPWTKKKNQLEEYAKIIENAVFLVLTLMVPMKVLLPDGFLKVAHLLNVKIEMWPENESEALKQILKEQVRIETPEALYAKIDEKAIETERTKITLGK